MSSPSLTNSRNLLLTLVRLKSEAQKGFDLSSDLRETLLNEVYQEVKRWSEGYPPPMLAEMQCMTVIETMCFYMPFADEKIRELVLDCLDALFSFSITQQIVHEIQDDEISLTHQLAQIIFVLKDYSIADGSRSLKLKSLHLTDKICSPLRSEIFVKFFPGIITGYFRVLTGDFKQGSKVFSSALEGLTNSISKANLAQSPHTLSSEDWFRVDIVLKKIYGREGIMKDNPLVLQKPNFRSKFVETSAKLFTLHIESLKEDRVLFLESVLSFVNDPLPQIETETRLTLERLSPAVDIELRGEMKENMYRLLKNVSSMTRGAEETSILNHLRMISGYLYFMSTEETWIDSFIDSCLHLLVSSLMIVSKLELYDVTVNPSHRGPAVRRKLVSDQLRETGTSVRRWHFAHFRSEEVEEAIENICVTLGRVADLQSLLDHMLNILTDENMSNCHREALLLFKWMIKGVGTRQKGENCRSVLDALFMEHLWSQNVPTSTIADANSQILVRILVMDTISQLSLIQGKMMDDLMPDLIYNVCEQLGDVNTDITDTAWKTLHCLAQALDTPSPHQLMSDNSDYIVDNICKRMEHLDRYPRTPQILRGILEYFQYEQVAPLLADTLDSVFVRLDARSDPQTVVTFINILSGVVGIIRASHGKANREKSPRLFAEEIASKAKHFLSDSHRDVVFSALEALGSSIQLAAEEETGGFLPLVNDVWPLLKRKWKDRDPHVRMRGLNVATAICEQAGDFMVTRLKEDLKSKHEGQVVREALRCLSSSLSHVILRDGILWEIGCACQKWMERGVEKDIQEEAAKVYRSVCEIDIDIGWLLVNTMMGTVLKPKNDKLAVIDLRGKGKKDYNEEILMELNKLCT
ncbi:hypothetical protein PROFUN_13813 [Planoprotostelium fungivorum]|uniref:Uncharacterized protein n=1 Tax=Planoprotostelium fungivorum TaxID=1890364 RepID=A0A2P6N2Z6_9EUKA|nr:hypothetical protein PROFUN_13813 [Planoprotostelium fungivorum]